MAWKIGFLAKFFLTPICLSLNIPTFWREKKTIIHFFSLCYPIFLFHIFFSPSPYLSLVLAFIYKRREKNKLCFFCVSDVFNRTSVEYLLPLLLLMESFLFHLEIILLWIILLLVWQPFFFTRIRYFFLASMILVKRFFFFSNSLVEIVKIRTESYVLGK